MTIIPEWSTGKGLEKNEELDRNLEVQSRL
jgi:hypothetical protein